MTAPAVDYRGKVILCRCEDVTLGDVLHSISLGYTDIEEVKRYTGFGTGPCQGKECHALVATAIAEHTGCEPAGIPPFTSRSPISPTRLGLLATMQPDPAEGDAAGGRDGEATRPSRGGP